MARHFGLVGSPSSAGAFAPGQERAPAVLRKAGLVAHLEGAGHTVTDFGDQPVRRWRPEPENPRAMNLEEVVANARGVAGKVKAAIEGGAIPLVLGGDCTAELGTVLAASSRFDPVRLVYFDPHPDLNTPGSVRDGALDWTGVAHMLGLPGTIPELAELGARPALAAENLSLLGHSRDRSQPGELEAIGRLGIATVAEAEVAADPEASAERALAPLGAGSEPFLVHFDVDALDFTDTPISENADRNVGLTLGQSMSALASLTAADGFAALTITELNPDHAPDGRTIDRFVEALVEALA